MSSRIFVGVCAAVWLLPFFQTIQAQTGQPPAERRVWRVSNHASAASLRGLSVVDERIVWASGSGGTVLKSADGGQNWQSAGPPDCGDLDFRDIHAWDPWRAVIASAGAPSRIYQTADGGHSWNLVFEDLREGVFFDALAFWNPTSGMVLSDPVAGRILLVETRDAGNTWQEIESFRQPAALPGEAGFAASGTCLYAGEEWLLIGLGGARENDPAARARILKSADRGNSWDAVESPLRADAASGIFSLAFANRDHGVAVGGNYTRPDDRVSTACYTSDGGRHWKLSETPPGGYRSCVAVHRRSEEFHFVCVGPTGTDRSTDGGRSWLPVDPTGFHAVAFSPDGTLGIATGAGGRIGIWQD